MKATGAYRVLIGFIIFFLIGTTVIWIQEPHITTWGDSFWYCFSLVSTRGFGDVVVYTPASRLFSVLMSIYAVVSIAIVTGVIVSFYNQLVRMRMKDSLSGIINRLELLPELSKEELAEISERVRKI